MKTAPTVQNQVSTIVLLVSIWLIYATLTIILQNGPTTKIPAGTFITVFESLLDLTIAAYAFYIWKHSQGKIRTIFLLFTLAFLCDGIANAFYNYDMHVLQMNYLAVSFFTSSFYNIPITLNLFLELITWTIILRNIKNPLIQIQSKIINYIPIYIILITPLIVISWQYDAIQYSISLAPHLIYDYIQFVFFFINIILILLCSILIRNRWLFIIAFGHIISIATSIGIDLGITATPFGTKNVLEYGWALGLLFNLYGFYDYKNITLKSGLSSSAVPTTSATINQL